MILLYHLVPNSNIPTSSPQPAVTTTENSASLSATLSEISVTLSEQNKSSESGTATLMEVDGKVKVYVSCLVYWK